MLDSHPAARAYFELFDPGGKDPPDEHPPYFAEYAREHSVGRNPLARARLCFAYLDEIYSPEPGLDAVGFKLMYGQARRNAAVIAYLIARRVRIVHLVRSNLLDIVVSRETAGARGRFNSSEVDAAPVTVSLDPPTVAARLTALDRHVRTVRRLIRMVRLPAIEVTYEHLAANPEGFGAILQFLGVDDANRPLSSDIRKINPFGKQETIANYDEIRAVLTGTRFARFLD
jgi:hypothetical protein